MSPSQHDARPASPPANDEPNHAGGGPEPPDERYLIQAPSSLSAHTHRVLKHGDTFALFDLLGDVPSHGTAGHGVYHDGTRHLSHLLMSMAGERLLLLSSSIRNNNILLVADLTNPSLHDAHGRLIAHGTMHVMRSKFLSDGCVHERIQVTNHGSVRVQTVLALECAADFVDLFEVRGTHRNRRGRRHPSQARDDGLELAYTGLDQVRRGTQLRFDPPPDHVRAQQAIYHLGLEPQESCSIYVTVRCLHSRSPAHPDPADYSLAQLRIEESVAAHERATCEITSSNPQFNEWIHRASADLRMMITDMQTGPYPYAGVPWFSTPFGRDGIWTALETLWYYPQLARGVLRYLAANQADRCDPRADAEPGKILHESRGGEMAVLHEIPFGRYYGSVDSTPLFVMLAGEYLDATGDLETITALWPHLESALAWMDQYGDPDGDGFIEYGHGSPEGLLQQGWKDSHDSVFHADGRDAPGPIALVEVQAYAYAARRGAARMAEALGRTDRAAELRAAAERLRERFNQDYWCEEIEAYVLALDGDKRPCKVLASNSGHCLYCGIANPPLARRLANRLMAPAMFSGWGVRTLANCERRYNPMAYHNGSVWPHDTAIVAAGLARYGRNDLALRIFQAMFDASQWVDLNRLPELFCGFERRPHEGPTLYPAACAPQTWATAALFMLLQAVCGIRIDGLNGRVCLERPALPAFLEWVMLKNLRVGRHQITLRLYRHPEDVGILVIDRSGPVEVVSLK